MKVQWVTNVAPTPATVLLGQNGFTAFGGWVDGSMTSLSDRGIEFAVAFPGVGPIDELGVADNGVSYTQFPSLSRRDAARAGMGAALQLLERANPDLVHIHGTELPHSLSFALAARSLDIPAVVSIQGLVSEYANRMANTLPWDVVRRLGRRPWRRTTHVLGLKHSFAMQGQLERNAIKACGHVIGRTSWDRACVRRINPEATYHHCNESLRSVFYDAERRDTTANDRSLFVAQGHYPIKGLHLLLQALPQVSERHPGTLLTVAGLSPIDDRRSTYAAYIRRLLRDLDVVDRVRFVGPQDADQMLGHYQRSEIVVCPSLLENSPNSVSEAMLLGVPVVAAHVGGIPDLIAHRTDGLTYQAEAPHLLAEAIVTLFDEPEFARRLAANAQQSATVRHDRDINARRTLEIYHSIVRGDAS